MSYSARNLAFIRFLASTSMFTLLDATSPESTTTQSTSVSSSPDSVTSCDVADEIINVYKEIINVHKELIALRAALNQTDNRVSELQEKSLLKENRRVDATLPHLVTGCQDAYLKGARERGVYVISLPGSSVFGAWCDFDSSGGWMVIQRRVDGTVDFFRGWTEYESGFGNVGGEHWLGLDKMHLMTPSAVPLSIYMEAFDGDSAWANYSTFRIGDAVSQYKLTVSTFSGSAGDSFSYHSGFKFTARDRDNDVHASNCAQRFIGSWWYGNCLHSNLNGRYERGNTTSLGTSNCWKTFKGFNYGLKTSIMKIRA